MHSVYNSNSAIRILNQTHRVKWIFRQRLNFRHECEIFRPSSRITSTDLRLQRASISHHILNNAANSVVEAHLPKDSLKVEDYQLFQLVSISDVPHPVDLVLRTKELKEVLAQSSFSYDVNVAYNLQRYSSIYSCSFQDGQQSNTYLDRKQTFNDLVVLCSDKPDVSGDTGESDKPSKEQLLIVIDKLTQTLINFFEKPHDYTIYHKNIVFENNIKRVIIKGLTAYMQAMTLLRLCGFVQYAKVKVEILKVTHHIEDGSIRVRWRVNGISRSKAFLRFVKSINLSLKSLVLSDEAQWLDGFSVFLVGKDGLIYKHICDKITPDEDQVHAKKADLKSKLLGLLDIGPRGPAAGSLQTLIPCCRVQVLNNDKKIT